MCLDVSILSQEVQRDLNEITSHLTHWTTVESLYLGTTNDDTLNKFKPLESNLVKLYTAILELVAELVSLVSDGRIGVTLDQYWT